MVTHLVNFFGKANFIFMISHPDAEIVTNIKYFCKVCNFKINYGNITTTYF